MSNRNKQQHADDGLYVNSDTTIEEIKGFVKRRVQNPVKVDDTVIWNFAGYKLDKEALRHSVRNKLHDDRYIIPFQVTGTWGYMFHLLPQELKDAEILVYDVKSDTYRGYTNFYSRMSVEEEEAFRRDLARRVSDVNPGGLDDE